MAIKIKSFCKCFSTDIKAGMFFRNILCFCSSNYYEKIYFCCEDDIVLFVDCSC